jgi:hypothetical protein
MHSEIVNIISRIENVETTSIPPTLLYNEGWMLRLVLDWFSKNPKIDHPLSFGADCKWYSEALLPSPFLNNPVGAKINEKHTHADGVVGKFNIGSGSNKGDLSLTSSCDFFYVVEAKMYSPLSKGITNAPTYNQAARYVACIADLLVKARLTNTTFQKLAFYVIMPKSKAMIIDTSKILKQENLIKTIQNRINQFEKYPLNQEFKSLTWLMNNLDDFVKSKIEVDLFSWEEILDFIKDTELGMFYKKCEIYNK